MTEKTQLEKLEETCQKGLKITVNNATVKWQAKDGGKTLWTLDTTPPREDGKERYTMSEHIQKGGDFTVDEEARQKNEQFPPQVYLTQTHEGGFKGGGGKYKSSDKPNWMPSDRDKFYTAVSCLMSANEVTCRLIEKEKITDSKGAMATITMLAHHNLQVLLGLREECESRSESTDG